MNDQENLGGLARDFLSSVDEATCLLDKKFGTRCILRLRRSGKIERCGVVKGNITYELHGTGCAVALPQVHVDFFYGPGGRIDGFDDGDFMFAPSSFQKNIRNIRARIF